MLNRPYKMDLSCSNRPQAKLFFHILHIYLISLVQIIKSVFVNLFFFYHSCYSEIRAQLEKYIITYRAFFFYSRSFI